ncbi:Crp/Fnr family transcriptional regulator [Pontibacter mangrovi]|uniref:Crp/Fnr family transcriptional regulator n=1 Tax=Pontibacter mangrovi TaxID=2589816 RepID=A0A501W6H7_9BACT|nr:Crp/Fnr family transcriptional regulator [Pontibacter mangrovi]TPE42417.1 Crp/Fnr family transcriptional regulator [Pontibacter mangrovi]
MDVKDLVQALIQGPAPYALQDGQAREQLEDFLAVRLARSPFPHRQLLLSAGQLPDYLYYVEKGLIRGYFYDDASGRPVTLFLWDEVSWAVPLQGFFHRQPSDIYLEVMPESVLLSLSRGQVNELVECLPAAETLLRGLLLRYCAFHKKRTKDLLTRSAWERYLDLLQTHPHIEQKVSKEVIASYLGVTPQSLSRLLRENGHP